MNRTKPLREWSGRIAAFAVPAAALVCSTWLLIRSFNQYADYRIDLADAAFLALPALALFLLLRLYRSGRKKGLRSMLLGLLCLPILLMAIVDLSSSFCAMEENYGVSLPRGGRVTRSCGFCVGFDRTELQELDYGGKVPDNGFAWKETDLEAAEILKRIFEELRSVDSRAPLENMELLREIEEKQESLLSCVVRNEPGNLYCVLLYDRDAQVLYLCESKW